MKLPFKFKGFGKSKDSDEDEDDFEDEELEAEEPDDEYDDDDDDEEGGPSALSRLFGDPKKRLIVIGAAAVVVVALLAGAGWMFLGGGDETAGRAERKDIDPDVPRVVMDVPPKSPAGSAAGSLNAIAAMDKGPGAGIVVPSVTLAAFANLSPPPAEAPLSAVPDQALIEQGDQGPLPMVGEDGRQPWQVYARPFDQNDARPRIAVIVSGLGLSAAATEAAIKLLPGAVTLAFDPYAPGLEAWIAMARRSGHEVLLSLPLEPANFPIHDPGPYALLTNQEPEENLRRLEFLLGRLPGYVGVATVMGSKFSTSDEHMRPVLMTLKERGLMFVDGGAEAGTLGPKIATEISLPRALNNMFLDANPSKTAIDGQLAKLEALVREHAAVVAIGSPNPSTLGRLAAWIPTLEAKKLVLAPVSALADKQSIE